MKMMYSLGAVLALVLIAAIGSGAGLQYVFGVLLPYAAFAVFLCSEAARSVTGSAQLIDGGWTAR